MACSKSWNKDAVEEERNCKLTYFFRDLLKNRIDFQIPRNETRDIVSSVDILVGTLVAKVTSSVPWLKSFSRLLKVGSMAERTSIKFPDEFDYIVISEPKGVEIEHVCTWRKGYAHIKVIDRDLQNLWRPFLLGDHLKGSFTHDYMAPKWSQLLAYLRSVGKKWVRRNHLTGCQPTSIWLPYFDCLGNAFMFEVGQIVANSDEDLICETNSGTMRVDRDISNHGPAFMPKFIWTPKHRKKRMLITVDITVAIEVKIEPHSSIIKEHDMFHPRIWEKLRQHGRYMLIPCNEQTSCPARLCFRLTFTETEAELVRDLSKHHKECYMLLKYIFNSGGSYSYLPSYVFKILVIKHDCFCKETANLAKCFKTLTASLIYHIALLKTEERIEPSRLLRLFMPGEKFKMNIPSIFIKGHNILDGKDHKFPCEQFLLSIERMLQSVETISKEDQPDDGNLKIVNNHATAALAYASSMVPFLDDYCKVDQCETCFKIYFRRYGK